MDLSIIIVSYQSRGDLERCLGSLHDPPPSTPHEIIVVDNHSSDGSAAAARRWAAVTVLEQARNLGFAAASNVGIRASGGQHLLLLNPDTVVPAGAVDRLMSELKSRSEVDVIWHIMFVFCLW
jgi:GT2 family glycosyltransferase